MNAVVAAATRRRANKLSPLERPATCLNYMCALLFCFLAPVCTTRHFFASPNLTRHYLAAILLDSSGALPCRYRDDARRRQQEHHYSDNRCSNATNLRKCFVLNQTVGSTEQFHAANGHHITNCGYPRKIKNDTMTGLIPELNALFLPCVYFSCSEVSILNSSNH